MRLDKEKVKELRLGRGWTQEQLAHNCGLSKRTIQRIEKDGIASLESTSALVATLEVTRADLLLVSAEKIQRRRNPPLWPLLGAALIGMVLGIGMTMLWG